MPATYEEIVTMRNKLIVKHGDETMMIASMVSFFYSVSLAAGEHARTLNMSLLTPIIMEHLERRGVSRDRFFAALHDMDVANETMKLLAALPD